MATDFDENSGIIKTAIQSVPVVKYALGLAAIAILVLIVRGANPDIGIVGMAPIILGVLILMILLIIVATIAESKSTLQRPAAFITWAASIALVALLAASVSAILFGWPTQLARLILPSVVADKPLIGPKTTPLSPASEKPVTTPSIIAVVEPPVPTTAAPVSLLPPLVSAKLKKNIERSWQSERSRTCSVLLEVNANSIIWHDLPDNQNGSQKMIVRSVIADHKIEAKDEQGLIHHLDFSKNSFIQRIDNEELGESFYPCP